MFVNEWLSTFHALSNDNESTRSTPNVRIFRAICLYHSAAWQIKERRTRLHMHVPYLVKVYSSTQKPAVKHFPGVHIKSVKNTKFT